MTTSIPQNAAQERTSDEYTPKKADKFSFGLWTVGNRGRDPFGDFVRPALDPIHSVKRLSELGAWGINLHDNDLVPIDATSAERDRIVREFKQALNDYGMVVPMATTNLLCRYATDSGYTLRFALEPKPNEPRSDTYLPTIGHMLAFIATLQHPEMVGVNPEVAHEHMAGLNFVHGVAQAIEANKLFHIDLNDQKGPRFDQDLRFGSENIKSMFFLVKLLEEKQYNGPRHFDAHAYRTEDEDGVWDFALGCMRTYNMFKEKVRRFQADTEIQQLLDEINSGDSTYEKMLDSGYSTQVVKQLKEAVFDIDVLGQRGFRYERLDQLTIEIILGMR